MRVNTIVTPPDGRLWPPEGAVKRNISHNSPCVGRYRRYIPTVMPHTGTGGWRNIRGMPQITRLAWPTKVTPRRFGGFASGGKGSALSRLAIPEPDGRERACGKGSGVRRIRRRRRHFLRQAIVDRLDPYDLVMSILAVSCCPLGAASRSHSPAGWSDSSASSSAACPGRSFQRPRA
jgi:hypothetical protein